MLKRFDATRSEEEMMKHFKAVVFASAMSLAAGGTAVATRPAGALGGVVSLAVLLGSESPWALYAMTR